MSGIDGGIRIPPRYEEDTLERGESKKKEGRRLVFLNSVFKLLPSRRDRGRGCNSSSVNGTCSKPAVQMARHEARGSQKEKRV